MADAARKITVSQSSLGEDDLPLPPPPPVPPRPLDYDGHPALTSPPLIPPKETFSTFYHQRQKSELKRLFKHIHPDLRAMQSMRWIFENWNLDNIGDPHATKKMLDDEELKGGDVRGTSSVFEHIDSTQQMPTKRQTSVRGDVRTSTWLFETQALDSLNKSKREEGELVEAVLKESIQPGDVTGTRLLFESKPLSDLGRCNSIEDHSFLKLRSELQEQKGDVQKTVKLFQAEPCCAIRDKSGNIHEVKSICREEIISSNISTARWLFETQPLDLINKGTEEVKIIRGISLEEGQRGGVDQKRWMFETQPFDTIQEVVGVDKFEGTVVECKEEADVVNKRKFFEMQPLAILKGDSAEISLEKEEVIGGDVKTSLWLFETQPMETLSDTYEVGCLKKITLSADEQGEVKGRKKMFEGCSIKKNTSFQKQEIERGDVKGFKHVFETIPLSKIAHSDEEIIGREDTIATGNMKGDEAMFEATCLYAIKDSSGNLHKVTTVSREELIKGKVKNYKWMFETRPLDELTEGKGNVEVIKGITRQEDTTADVKMAKWLFETQTIDGIHSKFNKTEHNASVEAEPCKDSIKDGDEYNLKLCNTIQDSVKSESGDVSRVKDLFESQSLDEIGSEMATCDDQNQGEHIERGSVHKFTWMFENCPMNLINKDNEDASIRRESGEESGDVHSKKFIFETSSLDKIPNEPLEQKLVPIEQHVSNVDVKTSTMMFESLPLYAIRDKEGQFHEVTTVKKEEVMSADVRGARWMFETKPLDAIKAENEVYVIRAVTQEDVKKGDVKSARWKFETQPLDSLSSREESVVRVTEDFGSSNVQLSKQIFESEQSCKNFVRMVSVTDVQQGDVRTSTWLFENQSIDSLKGEPQEQGHVKTVHREDSQQGDVKRCTWLFESQPLDKIKEPEDTSKQGVEEEIPKADVKCTTWLFETTALDKITANSVADTLEVEKGKVNTTVVELPVYQSATTINLERDQRIQNIVQMIDELLVQDKQKDLNEKHQKLEDKVVLREKKVKETEDERRNRLSVHKEEIMKGNVKTAMEIFENLRKREELKGILSQVQEIEEETSSVDIKSLTTLYENVPDWMATPSSDAKQSKTGEKKAEVETKEEDLESISSVETAFEDLEKARQETKEEASHESHENQFKKTDSANNQDNDDIQKKPVVRTDSLKGSTKQTENTKVKLGSWSKGKSPLSKLFMSSGSDRTNKVGVKDAKKPDVKPSGGVLGRLFQSSSEKPEDITKSATQASNS
ncbi:putative xin actin-binding repeat-containing protein 1 [Scophthalmus maximus]|uniref:Putative xin actin-binding repeat-containing protein 1 n=1 Tax=Scophthalmus maximus TaxID=52904 RepID=A0A2U9BKP3_SCOMX|nr:putative xin actin-binding repeat-containing protein 1 [Scophthalmus maximus]